MAPCTIFDDKPHILDCNAIIGGQHVQIDAARGSGAKVGHERVRQLRILIVATMTRFVEHDIREAPHGASVCHILSQCAPFQIARAIIGADTVAVIDNRAREASAKKSTGDEAVHGMSARMRAAIERYHQVSVTGYVLAQEVPGFAVVCWPTSFNTSAIRNQVIGLVVRAWAPVFRAWHVVDRFGDNGMLEAWKGKLMGHSVSPSRCVGPRAVDAAPRSLIIPFRAIGAY